jgi:hypothetical protein
MVEISEITKTAGPKQKACAFLKGQGWYRDVHVKFAQKCGLFDELNQWSRPFQKKALKMFPIRGIGSMSASCIAIFRIFSSKAAKR